MTGINTAAAAAAAVQSHATAAIAQPPHSLERQHRHRRPAPCCRPWGSILRRPSHSSRARGYEPLPPAQAHRERRQDLSVSRKQRSELEAEALYSTVCVACDMCGGYVVWHKCICMNVCERLIDSKSRWRMGCTFYEILCDTHPSVCTDNPDEVGGSRASLIAAPRNATQCCFSSL